jgi:hypothetical protein
LPKWYELVLPADKDADLEEGSEVIAATAKPALLLSVQLIAIEDMISSPIAIPSIVPPMRDAWIEVIVFGLRNLAPYQLRPIVHPQVVA